MKELKIGSWEISLPIIQGGMGVGVSLSNLASAVANEGGVGVISAAGIGFREKDFYSNFLESNIRALRKEIQLAKSKTEGYLGVNIMVAMSNFGDMVKTSIEEKIDFIFSGAGLPLDLPKYLNDSANTKLVPIISSAKAAKIITRIWLDRYDYLPDAFVVEGPKAGGHLGFKYKDLERNDINLIDICLDVKKTLLKFEKQHDRKIPVIAAGGVYTGEDIYEIQKVGIDGVQMATRFVTTKECDASDEFKKEYINASKDDIRLIKSPVGMPGRAVENEYIIQVEQGNKKPFTCPYHCIKTCDYETSPYCISLALINAQKGRLKHGFAFAGVNAYKAEKIISVSNLIETLKKEYNEAMNNEEE
ncbi:MAG: NAD(P)H-dependent flavin oxidoreductase [Clostridia bacterium]